MRTISPQMPFRMLLTTCATRKIFNFIYLEEVYLFIYIKYYIIHILFISQVCKVYKISFLRLVYPALQLLSSPVCFCFSSCYGYLRSATCLLCTSCRLSCSLLHWGWCGFKINHWWGRNQGAESDRSQATSWDSSECEECHVLLLNNSLIFRSLKLCRSSFELKLYLL